jgi:tryptophan-rich sensory protein
MILHIIKKDYKKFIWVFYINILYFLWVCFATMLQISITILNW